MTGRKTPTYYSFYYIMPIIMTSSTDNIPAVININLNFLDERYQAMLHSITKESRYINPNIWVIFDMFWTGIHIKACNINTPLNKTHHIHTKNKVLLQLCNNNLSSKLIQNQVWILNSCKHSKTRPSKRTSLQSF